MVVADIVTKQSLYILPLVAIIIGLRFLALGPVFQSRFQSRWAYAKGVLIYLIALITLFAPPQKAIPVAATPLLSSCACGRWFLASPSR